MDYLESILGILEKNINRKKKVFVSFDYTNENQSDDISVIKSC